MSTAAKRLKAAQEAHAHLQNDLQHFEQLIHDNQQTEAATRAAYRTGDATFDQVREAMTATHTARELLEQHRSDITAAIAELKAATEADTRARGVAEINTIAGQLRVLQEAISDRASAMLEHLADCSLDLTRLQLEHAALRDAWRSTAREKLDVGRELLNSRDILSYLKGEGVDVEPLSRGPTGRSERPSFHSTGDPLVRPLHVTIPQSARALIAANTDDPVLHQAEVELLDIRVVVQQLVDGASRGRLVLAEVA